MSVAEWLKKSEYFQGFPEKFFQDVVGLFKKREAKEGDVLVVEGEAVKKIFILESGDVIRTRSNPTTHESFTVDGLSPGAISGLLHVLRSGEPDPSFASIRVQSDAVVYEVSAEELVKFIAGTPEYALALMAKLSTMLRSSSRVMRQLKVNSGAAKGFIGMRILCYDSSAWVRTNFTQRALEHNETAPDHMKMEFEYTSDTLGPSSVTNCAGFDGICLFVNDDASAAILKQVSLCGIRVVAMRCAGFDRVDKNMAETLGLTVARVPAYSPYAVAEHAVSLFMTLNRKIHRAVMRVREFNFLLDGLVGFDLHGKTVGLFGTGKIGRCLADIVLGFGVTLLCYDPYPSDDLKQKGGQYVEPDEVWSKADVVFLFTPLMPSTHHMFNKAVLPKLKKGMTLINTSRGGLVETEALIEGLRSGVIAAAGLDVYEHEAAYFFRDMSDKPIDDPMLQELTSFNNVILTAHQAFFTQEAIDAITLTTISNLKDWREGKKGKEHPNSIF